MMPSRRYVRAEPHPAELDATQMRDGSWMVWSHVAYVAGWSEELDPDDPHVARAEQWIDARGWGPEVAP